MRHLVVLLALAGCGRLGFDEGRGLDVIGGDAATDAPRDGVIDAPSDAVAACPIAVDNDGDGVPCTLDCDDTDDRAFPGQTMFFATARNSGGYDFDCSGSEEAISCVDSGGTCAGMAFVNSTCGQVSFGGACTGTFPSCTIGSGSDQDVPCR